MREESRKVRVTLPGSPELRLRQREATHPPLVVGRCQKTEIISQARLGLETYFNRLNVEEMTWCQVWAQGLSLL